MPTAIGILAAGLAVGVVAAMVGLGSPPEQPVGPAEGTGSSVAAPADVQPRRAQSREGELAQGEPRERQTRTQVLVPNPRAARKLHEIADDTLDPSLSRYEDVVAALTHFPDEFPGAQEIEDAKLLLADVEARYGRLADEELVNVKVRARTWAYEGKYSEATSLLRYVQARFRGSEWFRTRGEAEIAEVQKGLDEARADAEARRAAEIEAMFAANPQGLLGEYFNGRNLESTKLAHRRVDSQLDFSWGAASPAPGVGADNFSVRWTGELKVPADGRYELHLGADDLAALWIGEGPPGPILRAEQGERTAAVDLKAGWTPIRLEMKEGGGSARVKLSWSGPGFDVALVDTEHLRPQAEKPAVAAAAPALVSSGTPLPGTLDADDEKIEFPSPETGQFTLSFDIVLAGPRDMGVCLQAQEDRGTGWSDFSYIVNGRDGEFKVRDGDTYRADALVSYEAGKTYRVKMEVDVPAKTYDVYVTDGATTTQIADDYSIRDTASDATNISRIVYNGDGAGGATVTNVVLEGAPAAPAPATPEETTETREVAAKWPKEPLPGETGQPGQWAPGLVAEIFEGKGYTKPVAVRIDPAISFRYGDASPDPKASRDDFTVRWTGWLLVPYDGKYTFEAQGDDSLKVSLGGKPLVSAGPGKKKSKARLYTAGLYPISATLYDGRDNAGAHLRWQMPNGGKFGGISGKYYFHKVPEFGALGPPAELEPGLSAEYYAGESFEQLVAKGACGRLKFDCGEMPVCSACPKDHFSVRMTGYLLVPKTGTYRFEVTSDDGVRLRVDGSTVIDQWGGGKKLTGEAYLSSGFRDLVVEYMEQRQLASLTVKWDPPGGDRHFQEVPSTALFREPGERVTVDREGLAPGLKGRIYRGERPGGKALVKTYAPSTYFNWDKKRAGPGVPKNRFSAGWSGKLIVPMTGVYLFRVRHYGGVRLAIARKPVVNRWKPNAGWQEARIPLRKGTAQFELAYFNREKRAGVEVYWAGPNFAFRSIGPGSLAHKSGELAVGEILPEPGKAGAVAGVTPGGAAARKPPEKLPEGNQVKNGGFEEKDDQTKFARFWKPHQWGEPDVRYSIRIDRAEPHRGEAALAVKAFGDGARPGAYTTLTLPAGRYELSYWACADVDEKARVGAHLAGHDLEEKAVGDQWQQFKQTVDIPERQVGATLRLWTTTKAVRVWLDDVEVNAVR